MQQISASEFEQLTDLPEWRFLLGRIETVFRVDSFERASSLIGKIVAAADAADHHPDIDLRYPGRVRVSLTTHSIGGLSQLDIDLARIISRLASEDGASSEPEATSRIEIAIDALDIEAVRPFWAAVFGYVESPAGAAGQVTELVDPQGIGPAVWFQQMEAPRSQRNRIHIDVSVPHDLAEARLEAALEAGGTLVSAEFARSWWVLADVEGNEACICTWQDRYNDR